MQIWIECRFDILRLKFDVKSTAEEHNTYNEVVPYSKISSENTAKAGTLNIDNLNP